MRSLRSAGGLGLAILLLGSGASTPRAAAQAAADSARSHKSVRGTLDRVDTSQRGVYMKSDSGQRMAWRFDAAVVAEVARFKPGDAMIVIYRQVTPADKKVTAVAFPGSAPTALYVNMTGSSVLLRSAPATDGVCGKADAGPVSDSVIPDRGMAEASGACWCCAPSGGSCTPGNKTGEGKALLVSCFE